MLTSKDSGLLNAQTELPEAKRNLHIPEDFDRLNKEKKVGMLYLSCSVFDLQLGKCIVLISQASFPTSQGSLQT